jgi:phospholipid/cholesterol/gamma-HCH transport system substrate-binding protein
VSDRKLTIPARFVPRLIAVVISVTLFSLLMWWGSRQVAQPVVGQNYYSYALFRDGSGLPPGSAVVIAGVRVGEISDRSIEGGLAKITMRLRDDVILWTDAWATKRATSVLGDSYVELLPGGPDLDGAAEPGLRRLVPGEPIGRVIEGSSTDRTLRAIDTAMPRISNSLISARAYLQDARRYVNGPLTQKLEAADQWTREDHVAGPLAKVNSSLGSFENWVTGVHGVTSEYAPQMPAKMDRAARSIAEATRKMREARTFLSERLTSVRSELDQVDSYLDRAAATVGEWNGNDPDHQGTLAKLINDDELGETLHDGSEDIADFTSSLDRLKSWIGLRTEYNLSASQPRIYVVAEIAGRNNNFYVLEAERGELGVPQIELRDQTGTGQFTQRATLQQELRFSLQWGKRFGPVRLRAGIKESTPGAGGDVDLLTGRLRLSADAFDASFARLPRLKLGAAFALFRSVYLVAGVDDVLNAPRNLPIAPWPAGNDVPRQLDEVHLGRDYFVGAMLQFSDADFATLLRLYGAMVLGLL